MPLDPFFTSKSKDEFHEEHQKKKALAKAIQFRIHTYRLPEKRKAIAMRNKLESKVQGLHQVTNRPSLNGFKKPTRVWTKTRTSQNPE